MITSFNKILVVLLLPFVLYSCKDNSPPPEPVAKSLHDSLVIDGYLQQFSFNHNEKIELYLNAKHILTAANLGVYDVNEKLVDYISCSIQPQSVSTDLPYQNGYKYSLTTTYNIPQNLKSGLYFVAKKIPLIIKNDNLVKSKLVIVHPTNTDIAYNKSGGMSLYFPSQQVRARVLSTLRPWVFSENGSPMAFYKWLATTPYDIAYICDSDLDNYQNIENYQAIIIAGHSEYWTKTARLNFDKFVDSHHNALVLSGNAMYWQVRLDNVKNQMICYKYDAFYNDPISTTNILLTTGRWEQSLLQYNPLYSIGAIYYSLGGFPRPEKLGFGGYKIQKPDSPIFKNINYKFGDILKFDAEEYDGANIVYIKHPTIPNQLLATYDNSQTKFYKVALLAYDLAYPDYGGAEVHNGTMLAIRKKSTSGLIINMAASNWCFEIEKNEIKQITLNALEEMLQTDNTQDLLFL